MRMKWLKINHNRNQLLSGHGKFKAKLATMGLADEETCDCGRRDTYEHAILQCIGWEEERKELSTALETNNPVQTIDETLLQECTYEAFEKFISEILMRKEEEETGLESLEPTSAR